MQNRVYHAFQLLRKSDSNVWLSPSLTISPGISVTLIHLYPTTVPDLADWIYLSPRCVQR